MTSLAPQEVSSLLRDGERLIACVPAGGVFARLNSSEGSALGPFMYFVTLFTHDDESVSAAFKSPDDREAYKALVVGALAPALG